MTFELALTAAGAAIAVTLLIGLAFLLGFRGEARIESEAQLAELITGYDGAVSIAHALVSADGRAGLARLADGRWAAVRVMGGDFAIRVSAAPVFVIVGQELRAQFGDVGFPALKFSLHAPAPVWLKDGAAGG